MVKVFVTGVTGYIGGSAFDTIYHAHKNNEYTLFVRNEARAQPIRAKYPSVKFVYGTLDDVDVIEKAASEADVVIHTAESADSVSGATAIAKGLKAGHTPEAPGYWIHLSGTGILTWNDTINKREGEPPRPEEKYNDVDGIDRLLNLPDHAFHRDVDKIVQESNSDTVKAAIVCPCTIYESGTGPVNTRSIQVPALVRFTLTHGYAPVFGPGKTEWDNVNIHDLSNLYLKLFEATQDPEKSKNPEIFGKSAYFFAANGVHVWTDVAKQVVEEVKKQGLRKDATIKQATLAEISKLEHLNTTWAVNSKGEALRAKKYLGWEPKGPSLESTIAEAVRVESKVLGH